MLHVQEFELRRADCACRPSQDEEDPACTREGPRTKM